MRDKHIIKKENNQVRVLPDETFKFKGTEPMRVSIQGDRFAEATFVARKPKQSIRKIDADRYIVLSTGEIREFDKRVDTKKNDNLRKTFARLTGLLRNNFTNDSNNQLFITLTYKENMTDPKVLYKDFEKFMKRLRYRYKDKHKLEYVTVAEPQGRGAWHMHLMLKSDKPMLYIDNRDMEEIWSHGFTDTERLKSDDVGTYYVTYFTDMLDEEKLADGEPLSKARQKGERLKLYPKEFNFYRASRGIKKPTEETMLFDEVVSEYGKPKYEKGFNIMNGDICINQIAKASFKKQ